MPEPDKSDGIAQKLPRRAFTKGVGAAGLAAGLAGCGGTSGGDGGGDGGDGGDGGATQEGTAATTQKETGTPESEGEPLDSSLTVAQWAIPKDSQYNPYNSKNYAEPRRMIYDGFMNYNFATGETTGYAVSEWSFDDSGVELTVREGQMWHDGDDVTADDLLTQLKLDMYTGGSLEAYVDDVSKRVTTVDDRTVRIEFTEPFNEQIILAFIRPKQLATKADVYGEYLQAFEDASTDKEESKAQSKLQDFSIKNPTGNGPFKFDNADSKRTKLVKFEDHPDADNVNYPEMDYRYLPSNQKRWSALINNKTDGSATLFMPSNKLKQLPDSIRVGLIPRHWGMGLVFNYNDEHVSKQGVRQAMAYVIERPSVASASGAGTNSKEAVSVPSCLTSEINGDVENKWLDGVYDQFNTYPTSEEKAVAALESAGYSKSGGKVKDADGNQVSLEIKAPAGFTDWVAGARVVAAQLKAFGFDAQLITQDTSTYWGKLYGDGAFQVALQGWANYNQSYPYFHFNDVWNGHVQGLQSSPQTVEVETLGGGVEEVDTVEKINTLSTQSGDGALGTIQELAYVTNQFLPVLPLQEKLAQTFLSSDDWNVPPRDSDKLQTYWPTNWGPRLGWWNAKRE